MIRQLAPQRRFGVAVLLVLAACGRDAADFSPVERLCYTGKRAMGALEFSPSIIDKYDRSVPVEVSELVGLAQEIMQERAALDVTIGDTDRANAEAIRKGLQDREI